MTDFMVANFEKISIDVYHFFNRCSAVGSLVDSAYNELKYLSCYKPCSKMSVSKADADGSASS